MIKNLNNLTLIGSSHVSKQSNVLIKKTFDQIDPDMICVELDHQRLVGMLKSSHGKQPSIFDVGVAGYLFVLVGGYVQRFIAKKLGVVPGTDMLTGVKLAKENQKPLYLIDQPVQITLRRLSKAFTLKEWWHVISDIFTGLLFPKKTIKKLGLDFDISTVPDEKIILSVLDYVKERYPSVYRVLIHERNIYMSHRLQKLQQTYPEKRILSVVGAGHVPGMLSLLE